MNEDATRVTRVLSRADGSEVEIVAQAYFGTGLHRSIGADVFQRPSAEHAWSLCDNRPHPAWRQMSVEEYQRLGRSEMLRVATHAEILAVTSLIGAPVAKVTPAEKPSAVL